MQQNTLIESSTQGDYSNRTSHPIQPESNTSHRLIYTHHPIKPFKKIIQTVLYSNHQFAPHHLRNYYNAKGGHVEPKSGTCSYSHSRVNHANILKIYHRIQDRRTSHCVLTLVRPIHVTYNDHRLKTHISARISHHGDAAIRQAVQGHRAKKGHDPISPRKARNGNTFFWKYCHLEGRVG